MCTLGHFTSNGHKKKKNVKRLTGKGFRGTQNRAEAFLQSRKTPAPSKSHTEPMNQQTNRVNQNVTSVSAFVFASQVHVRQCLEEL